MRETAALLSMVLFVGLAAAAPKASEKDETPDQKLARLKDDATSGVQTAKKLRQKIAAGSVKVKREEVQAAATNLDNSIQGVKATTDDQLTTAIKEREKLNAILSEEGDPTP